MRNEDILHEVQDTQYLLAEGIPEGIIIQNQQMEQQQLTTPPAIIIPEELSPVATASGLQTANEHAVKFAPFMITCNELSAKIASINKDNPTDTDVKIAREVRLALVKNRTASDKVREQSKATLLAEGNLIQGLYNVIKNKSLLCEADFEAIEKAAEIKEAARKQALLQERTELLAPLGIDITGYNLADMSDTSFSDLITSQKLLKAEREAAAAKAEAERLEKQRIEAEERERMRAENERLKAEADKAAAAAEAERKAAAIELALIKAEADKVAKEQAAKLKAEQDKAAKAEAELKARNAAAAKAEADKKAAEAKAAAELKAAAKKAAAAPDKEKLTVMVNNLSLVTPEISSEESKAALHLITEKFNAFKVWALQQIQQA